MTSIGCGPGCDAVGVVAVLLSLLSSSSSSTVTESITTVKTVVTMETTTNTNHDERNDLHQRKEHNHLLLPNKKFVLDRIVFRDWAMKQWYHPILKCVSNMLTQPEHPYVQTITCETCDVRRSVQDQQSHWNGDGKKWFSTTRYWNDPNTTTHRVPNRDMNGRCDNDYIHAENSDEGLHSHTELVVISYLLSETRNAWYTYMDEYIRRYCKVGTLFLITDPTAWQLHIFRQRYEFDTFCPVDDDREVMDSESIPEMMEGSKSQQQQQQVQRRVLMEFQWLDSSMYRPELQELEGRNGPGVLLAMKVAD
jgi:hypothetical protein